MFLGGASLQTTQAVRDGARHAGSNVAAIRTGVLVTARTTAGRFGVTPVTPRRTRIVGLQAWHDLGVVKDSTACERDDPKHKHPKPGPTRRGLGRRQGTTTADSPR